MKNIRRGLRQMFLSDKKQKYIISNNTYLKSLGSEPISSISFNRKNKNVVLKWKNDKNSLFILRSFRPTGDAEILVRPHKRVLNPFKLEFNIPKCLMRINNLFGELSMLSMFLVIPSCDNKSYFLKHWPFGNVFNDGTVCMTALPGVYTLAAEQSLEDMELDLNLYVMMLHSAFFDTNFNRDLKSSENLYRLLDSEDREKYNIKSDNDLNTLIFRQDIP